MSQNPDLKGSSFTLSVLHLSDNDISNAVHFLKQKIEQAPAFFAHAPVVLNIGQVESDIDFRVLKSGIEELGMVPVGVAGSKDSRVRTLISQAGLAVMTSSKAPAVAPAQMQPVQIVHAPVRSGQQIYAKDRDLVILNHVSAGAEVIADGTIHIHGTLRGRAIAGASGSTDAKIICSDLQAELVSIAGHYWLSDQIESEYWGKKVLFGLTDGTLCFDILTI